MILRMNQINLPDSVNYSRGQVLRGDCVELAASMDAIGMTVPIMVDKCPVDDKDPVILVAGFRRFMAANILGWDKIRAIEKDPRQSNQVANLTENMAREDLSYYESIMALQRAFPEEMSQRDVAKQLGVSRSWVQRHRAPLKMGDKIMDQIRSGRLSQAQVKLLMYEQEEEREELAEKMASGGKPVKKAGRKHTRSKKELQRLGTLLMSQDKPDCLTMLSYAAGEIELEEVLSRLGVE